jgi:hypothetical protein
MIRHHELNMSHTYWRWRVEQWCEVHYPSFIQIGSIAGDVNQVVNTSDAKARASSDNEKGWRFDETQW